MQNFQYIEIATLQVRTKSSFDCVYNQFQNKSLYKEIKFWECHWASL